MMKLISFDISSDFGSFKVPETNEGMQQTYGMLHKPALLGILGAIAGLGGMKYNEKPEYLEVLGGIKVGIMPIGKGQSQGVFVKMPMTYTNTLGYGNKNSTLIVQETVLISPSFRCFVLLDEQESVHSRLTELLKSNSAIYIPYMGKNEFPIWWTNYTEYQYACFDCCRPYSIVSLFDKGSGVLKNNMYRATSSFVNLAPRQSTFFYFERLPIGFIPELNQYELGEFTYTNAMWKETLKIAGLYEVWEDSSEADKEIIQLN